MRYMGRQQVTVFWSKLLTSKELCCKPLLIKGLYLLEVLDTQEVARSNRVLPIHIKLCKKRLTNLFFYTNFSTISHCNRNCNFGRRSLGKVTT